MFDVVHRGKLIPFHLCDTHTLCGRRDGPTRTDSNGSASSRNAKQVKSLRHQEESSCAPEQLDADAPFVEHRFFLLAVRKVEGKKLNKRKTKGKKNTFCFIE